MARTRTVFATCLETTTVKGIPRIIEHKSRCLRILWFIGVCLLLGVALGNVVIVMVEYFDYPSVSFLTEINLIKLMLTEGKTSSSIPSTTVCNLNPFASSNVTMSGGDSGSGVLNFDEYLQMVDAAFAEEKDNATGEYKRSVGPTINYLKSVRGYFNYIGLENATMVSHKRSNLIIECSLLFYTASGAMNKLPCRDSQFKQVVTPEFFNCYSIAVISDLNVTSTGIPLGLSLILQLDDKGDRITDLYDPDIDASQQNGFRLTVTTENAVPDLWYTAVDISPGFSNQLMLRYNRRERLKHPYGDCLDAATKAVTLYDIEGRRLAYTTLGCMNSCAMEIIASECLCLEPALLVTRNPALLNTTRYCSSLDSDLDTIVKDNNCVRRFKGKASLSCIRECQPDCLEFGFDRFLVATDWPKKTQQLNFYETVIKPREFRDNYKVYQDMLDLVQAGNIGGAGAMLGKTELIENNFAKVLIYLEDLDYNIIKDKPKFGTSNLLSQTGGAMNLYIGISFVLVVELLELLYNLVWGKRNQKSSNEEDSAAPGRSSRGDTGQASIESGTDMSTFSTIETNNETL